MYVCMYVCMCVCVSQWARGPLEAPHPDGCLAEDLRGSAGDLESQGSESDSLTNNNSVSTAGAAVWDDRSEEEQPWWQSP